jgi:hypothetical protein
MTPVSPDLAARLDQEIEPRAITSPRAPGDVNELACAVST